MKNLLILGLILAAQLLAVQGAMDDAPNVIPLWTGAAPGSEGKHSEEKVRLSEVEHEHIVSGIHHPSVTVFLPAAGKATGAAVIICPGGGHRELWIDHEGYNVAHWLAANGIAGFVLKYRLAKEEGSTYQVGVHSLADVQRAIRLVRSRAAEWGLDPTRVGVMGFSAGGELAALASVHSAGKTDESADPIDRQDANPAFQALLYPGNAESIAPAPNSPPVFIAFGYGERPEFVTAVMQAFLKFKQANVPAELHVYAGIGHGFGLRGSNHTSSAAWPERFREWLADRGFLGNSH